MVSGMESQVSFPSGQTQVVLLLISSFACYKSHPLELPQPRGHPWPPCSSQGRSASKVPDPLGPFVGQQHVATVMFSFRRRGSKVTFHAGQGPADPEQPIPEVRVQLAGEWPPSSLRSHCPEQLFHRKNRTKRTRNTPEGDTENPKNAPKGSRGSWLYTDTLVVVAEVAARAAQESTMKQTSQNEFKPLSQHLELKLFLRRPGCCFPLTEPPHCPSQQLVHCHQPQKDQEHLRSNMAQVMVLGAGGHQVPLPVLLRW